MALQRHLYDVHLATPDGGTITHRVEVRHADRMRAEFEARKQGIPPINEGFAMNHTTVWLWCALVRSGLYQHDYQRFAQAELIDFDPVKDALTGESVAVDVDPTQPDRRSGSLSPSPATTAAAPPTGSTPTSTTP